MQRRTLKWAAGIAPLALLAALFVVGYERTPGSGTPPPTLPDGWQATGIRVKAFDAGTVTAEVGAALVRLRRVRFGPFRLGFAWTLDVRDLAVDVSPNPTPTRLGPGTGAPRRPAILPLLVTAVEIDRLQLRLRPPDGTEIEIVAGRGELGWRDGDRFRLRNGVRVRRNGVEIAVEELDFDPAAHRFIGAGGEVDEVAVERVNALFEGIQAPDRAALLRIVSRLMPMGARGT